MKNLKIPLLLLGLVFAGTTGIANAQTAPLTRAQVKIERAEFMKSHHWDSASETWVVHPGYEAPDSMKTRAQIKSERDEFMKNNRWDAAKEQWVPLKGQPKGTLTREQVKAERAAFVRTYVWDSAQEVWVEKKK